MSPIPIANLEMTINRCRDYLAEVREKPWLQPPDLALEDLAALAGVYGMMIYKGQSSIACGEQSDAVQRAISRWGACCTGTAVPNVGAGSVSASPLAELPDLPSEEQYGHDQE